MSREDLTRLIFEVFGRRGQAGLLEDGDRRTRLVTHHNPHAWVSLASEVFDGPFDEQFGVLDGGYGLIFEGDRVGELPQSMSR